MTPRRSIVGLLAVTVVSLMAMPAMAEYPLLSNVVCPEGIFVGGVTVEDGQTWDEGVLSVAKAADVTLDWSDDIIYHQFPAGSKVRVEVVLFDETMQAYVFTLAAHFKVEKIDGRAGQVIGDPLFESSIGKDLWIEGPDSKDAYRAEINSEGWLLYGFNWETRGLLPGSYRLTFWIGDIPATDPLGNTISSLGVDVIRGSVGDVEPTSGMLYSDVYFSEDMETSWLELDLLPKENGR